MEVSDHVAWLVGPQDGKVVRIVVTATAVTREVRTMAVALDHLEWGAHALRRPFLTNSLKPG